MKKEYRIIFLASRIQHVACRHTGVQRLLAVGACLSVYVCSVFLCGSSDGLPFLFPPRHTLRMSFTAVAMPVCFKQNTGHTHTTHTTKTKTTPKNTHTHTHKTYTLNDARYDKIRRHQHTRVHAHTGPRRHARTPACRRQPPHIPHPTACPQAGIPHRPPQATGSPCLGGRPKGGCDALAHVVCGV